MQVLDGSCHTPIGAHGVLENGQMHLRVQVLSLDGSESYFEEAREAVGDADDALALGHKIGVALKARVPEGILKAA